MSAKSGDHRSASPARDDSSAQPGSGAALAPARKTEDVALVCGMSEDGQGVEVIRKRGERLETGTVRPLEAGKPIHGEVVRLRPRPHAPFVCDVDVEFASPARDERSREDRAGRAGEAHALGAGSGPAQVATESYRKNWDAVYGRARKPSLLN